MFGYLELFSGADKDLIGKFFSEHACQCILDHPDLAPVGGDNTDVFGRDQAIGPEQFLDVVLNVVDLQCVVEGGGQTVLGVLANHAVEHDWTVGVLDPVEIPKELGGRFVEVAHGGVELIHHLHHLQNLIVIRFTLLRWLLCSSDEI